MRKDTKGREIFNLVQTAEDFSTSLQELYDWIGCVPDSVFRKVLPGLQEWFLAPRENHLVGLAFGATIAGRRPTLLIQNSGLGLCLDALLGTFKLYKRGLVVHVSNRGVLDWEEIQHQDWGDSTLKLIRSFGFEVFDYNEIGVDALKIASELAFKKHQIVFVIIHRGNIDED